MHSHKDQPATKTEELFHKINNYTCIMGLLNLWGDRFDIPKITKKYLYVIFHKIMNLLICLLMLLVFGAVYKRETFTAKQQSDLIAFGVAFPLFYTFYLSILYYKSNVKELLLCLAVELKNVYNDKRVEENMVRRIKVYTIGFLVSCSSVLFLHGFDSILQVIRSGKTFTTILTIWPDIEDKSISSEAVRVAYYVVWWFLLFRTNNAYILAIATTICLSHQFQNLQSYFYGLEHIFEDQRLSQIEKEKKYEKAFKVGIKMHSDTLWCTRQCQIAYGLVYSGQMFISLMFLVILMLQMVNSERTISNAVAILATASAILLTTGIFMWNAGDVTVEAEKLAAAMYSSGWQNCQRASAVRVRKLVVIAMTLSQKPIIIRGFGIIEMSYGSYLSMVKFSYSVFSVIY